MDKPFDIPIDWKIAKAFAISPYRNARNLEAHWYALWTKVLTHLIRDRDNLILAPQYVLFYDLDDETNSSVDGEGGQTESELDGSCHPSSEDFGSDGDLGGYEGVEEGGKGEAEEADNLSVMDFETNETQYEQDDRSRTPIDSSSDPLDIIGDDEVGIKVCSLSHNEAPRDPEVPIPVSGLTEEEKAEAAQKVRRNREDNCLPSSDASNTSINTAPNSDCSAVIPDFCILHLCAHRSSRIEIAVPLYVEFSSGLTIEHECCPFVIENKKFPSRRDLEDHDEFFDEVMRSIFVAVDQLLRQCQHLFKKYEKASSVYAIAASGPFWAYKLVGWKDVYPDKVWTDGWTGIFVIGSEESALEMQKLGRSLDRLVYDLPGDDE